MKIALFTAGFSKYPIEKVFQVASELGYDGIEIAGSRPHAYPLDLKQGDYKKIIKLSQDYNLPIVSYAPENTGSPYSLVFDNDRMNKKSMDYFKVALEMSKQINSNYCMFACNHPGFGRNKENVKKRFIDNMRELASYAVSIDQTIILETVTPYEGTILVTVDDLIWAYEEIDSPNVKVMLDLAAPVTSREPIEEYFKYFKKDLRHIHFIDCIPENEDHLIPGDGSIDFDNLMLMLKKFDYNGYLSLELFSRYETQPVFAATKGLNIIKNLIENVEN